jgi:ABC-type branched-subunit amino acid transport system permease subunit
LSFYLSTIVVYFGADLMAAWGLNMQFGWAGVPNFAFIIFQAAGAYTYATVTLGPSGGITAFQHYILGANLPFPLPYLVAALAGGVVSLVLGLITLRPLRRDYQAAVFLLFAVIAIDVVSADVNLFNGSNGLAAIPQPLASIQSSVGTGGYQWLYAAFTMLLCGAVLVLIRRLGHSGWQRALRAARDDEPAARALGINAPVLRLQVFVIGGMIAGLSGGVLVGLISAWSPGGWQYSETFAVLTGIILGGVSNDWGVLIGTFLVQIAFQEVTALFLPQIGYPGLSDALVWVVIGLLWLVVLYFRPRGIWPEQRMRVNRAPAGPTERGSV